MSALRRVCSYCKRLIVGLNEPGGPSGEMTEHDSHGICTECLAPLMKQIEESKKNDRKIEGQAGPWNNTPKKPLPSLYNICIWGRRGDEDIQPGPRTPPDEQMSDIHDAVIWAYDNGAGWEKFTIFDDRTNQKVLSGDCSDALELFYVEERRGMNRTASDEPVKTTIFQGLLIGIENPSGSTRSGQSRSGHKWSIKMNGLSYGFICGSEGSDGDSVDVYLRDNPDAAAEYAYVIRQNNPKTGAFDEEKVMCGWSSVVDAVKAYVGQFDRRGFYGGCTAVKMSELHDKLSKMRKKHKAARV